MPVLHGDTSRGSYESSAFFISADTTSVASSSSPASGSEVGANVTEGSPPEGPEILFWGDVESTIDENVSVTEADDVNIKVWREAAIRWDEGRLGAVFVSPPIVQDQRE